MSDKPLRILIIDDEYQIRESMKFLIGDMGYETHAVKSVKETFTVLNDVDFHLIIVDLVLNDGDGEELILKVSDKYPAVKFIIHTGLISYTPSDNLKKIGLSIENVLFKPYKDLSDLENTIKLILNR